MRVLEVNTFADPVGGAELHMQQLVECLRARGHQVGVFAGSPDHAEETPSSRIVRRPDFDMSKLVRDEPLQKAFREFAARYRPDVVHVHNLYNFPAEMVVELGRVGVPVVQMLHDWNLVCTNSWGVFPDGTVCGGGPGAKCFEHGCQENTPYDERIVLAAHLRHHLVPRTFDAFTAPSTALVETLRANGFDPVHELPYWVPTGPPPPAVARESDRVLHVGRLVPEKGAEFLVRAWPEVAAQRPKATLTIVGDGPERPRLEALARELGLDPAAIFVGRLSYAEVQSQLARAACQVLPSIWSENSPLVCYESYRAGLPMVASDIGGLPAMVVPGETGLLAAPRDADGLAKRIVELLSDDALRSRLERGCRAAAAKYSRTRHADRLLDLFDDALARGPRTDRPDPEDLLAATDRLVGRFREVEQWALGMERHVHHLERELGVRGAAGAPLPPSLKHKAARFLMKASRRLTK